MPFSYEVRFWSTRHKTGRRRPYEVRWVVSGESFSRSHVTGPLAESFKSQLVQAARRGEGFDESTGLPESMVRQNRDVTWYELAIEFVDAHWAGAAARTRDSTADGLAPVTAVLTDTTKGAPDARTLHRVLSRWAFNTVSRASLALDGDGKAAIAWLQDHSIRVMALDDPDHRSMLIRRALDALSTCLDGSRASANTVTRKRRTFSACLKYAVNEKDLLASHPLSRVSWKAPKGTDTIDRRVVASPLQVRTLLMAVKARRPDLVAFYGCLYFGMRRPAEARALRRQDCELPAKGWGRLLLTASHPVVGRAWSDDGRTHEDRGLKHRSPHAVRAVPIPPEFVQMLRAHIAEFGVASDGRLFQSQAPGEGLVSVYTYGRTWRDLRKSTLTKEQAASPLAARPYDLRHAGITVRLNSGVPATEVAAWAGHSVEVLLRIYAGCIDGQEALWLQRIDDALGDPESVPQLSREEPGTTGNGHDPSGERADRRRGRRSTEDGV